MALRNASFAAISLIYTAENMGLHTCPMMGFSQQKLMDFLEVPEEYIPVLLIAIGKGVPAEEKTQLPRKEADRMIHFEKFSKKI
jgi:putative NAD(P)H nitroreductase